MATRLNSQDLKNAQAFLNRVDLKGHESMAMTELQIKLANMLQEAENPPPPEPPPPDDGPGE